MRSLISAFKDMFISADQKKPAHYKAWSERLRQVTLSKLLPLFCNLKDSIEDSLRKDYMEQVCDILKSLDDSSSLDCEYSAEAGETAIVQAKQSLLELWHHLLDCIEKVPVAEVNPIIFSVILWIMKRPEFDLMHLRWDATFTPTCEHHVLIMAYRYRKLLLSTLSYVVRNLNAFAEAYVRANSPRPLIEDISSSSPTSTSSGACSETLAHQDEDITTITTTTTTTTITEPFQQQQKQQKQQQQEGTPLEAIQPLPSPPPPPQQQQQPALEAEECEKKKGNKSEEDEDETKTVEASVPSEGESVDECGPIFKYTPKIPLSPPPPRSKSRKKVVPVQSQNTNTLYGSLPQPFAVFSAKILAFLFFRFPAIQDTIIKASLDNLEPLNPEEYGLKKTNAPYPPEKCPILFQWKTFHESVKKWNNDTKVDTIDHLPKTWLLFLSTRVEFFVEFYVEWICCACSKLNTHATADWLSVPGFVELTEAYFLLYSLPPSAPRPPQRYFFSCENLMLNTAVPLVLENIVRFHFCRTRVSDTGQVNECISFFESWLITLARARARVDSAFDATVLCAGIDGLLASDHHLILSKVLALFYNYAWIFHDTPRVALLGNVLLEKHFYHLFLHWDENVRNLFMQFILFRLLTCKRRDVVSAEVAAAAAAAASANTTSDSEQDDETATVTAVKPPETTEAKESKERERETKASTGTAATLEEGSRAVPESADFELIHKADAFIWAIGECAKQINSANAAARQSRRSGLRRSQLQHGSHQDAAAAAPRFVKGKKTYVTEDAPAPIVVSEECTEGAGREVEVAEEEEEEAMGTGGENEDGRLLKEGSVVIVEDEYDDDDDDDNDDNDDNDDEMGRRRRRRRRGSEQYEDFTAPPVPDNLKIYIDRSLREFKKHLSRYEDWEAKTKDEPPKLLLYPSY